MNTGKPPGRAGGRTDPVAADDGSADNIARLPDPRGAGWLDQRIRELHLADARQAPSPRLAELMRRIDRRANTAAAQAPNPATGATDS